MVQASKYVQNYFAGLESGLPSPLEIIFIHSFALVCGLWGPGHGGTVHGKGAFSPDEQSEFRGLPHRKLEVQE